MPLTKVQLGMTDTLVSGTAVTASGTSVDFTGIPAGAKRITVMFSGVSTNGTSIVQLQVGAGSVATTGYTAATVSLINTANTTPTNSSTSGFIIGSGNTSYDSSASSIRNGQFLLANLSGNIWTMNGGISVTGVALNTMVICTGAVSLGGTLDRVRITTVNGTDTFDAGTINIMYE